MAYRPAAPRRSFWTTRPFEWAVVAAVVIAGGAAVNRQYRDLEGQAEYAAIQSVLGSMRTALILDYLQKAANGKPGHAPTTAPNPIVLLQPLPTYAGPVHMADQSFVRPGNWMFDADCGCVGYRPLNPDWLEPRRDFPALWFKVGNARGVPELVAMHTYFWHGASIY